MTSRESPFHQELDFAKLYPTLTVEGSAKVGDHSTWVLRATTAEGDEETHYFDKSTGLLVRKDLMVDSPLGRVNAKILLEDYRKIDGINIAHTVRMLDLAPQTAAQAGARETSSGHQGLTALVTGPARTSPPRTAAGPPTSATDPLQ